VTFYPSQWNVGLYVSSAGATPSRRA